MDTTTSDELTITYTDTNDTTHRLRFQPCADNSWWRIEEVWNGCQWRPVGQERIRDLSWDG